MPATVNSILHDTKSALGLAFDYDPFDVELIMHINSVLSDLNQLGIGPEDGFQLDGDTQTWDALLNDELRLNNVKSYVYLAVSMLFDPPSTGYVLDARTKQLEKAEWRINVAREEIDNPPSTEPWDPEVDPWGEPIILDGGHG